MTKQKSKGIQVITEQGRTYLEVPHLEGKIRFDFAVKGPNTYIEVAKQLNEANLEQPTMAQNASLADVAWQNPEEKYSKEIIDTLRKSYLRCFNGILYSLKKEGVFIRDRPQIENEEIVMNASELESMLSSREEDGVVYSKDGSVRFVPFGYKIGEQSPKQLEKNHFVIALAGKEGAEKLARVSENYELKTCLYSFDKVDSDEVMVSSLYSNRNWYGGRLYVYGNLFDDDRDGRAFGLSPLGEAQTRKFSKDKTKQDNSSEEIKKYKEIIKDIQIGKQPASKLEEVINFLDSLAN